MVCGRRDPSPGHTWFLRMSHPATRPGVGPLESGTPPFLYVQFPLKNGRGANITKFLGTLVRAKSPCPLFVVRGWLLRGMVFEFMKIHARLEVSVFRQTDCGCSYDGQRTTDNGQAKPKNGSQRTESAFFSDDYLISFFQTQPSEKISTLRGLSLPALQGPASTAHAESATRASIRARKSM